MIPMLFEYPPKIGWCTKHNSTEALSEENKRYREALETEVKADTDITRDKHKGGYIGCIGRIALKALEPL